MTLLGLESLDVRKLEFDCKMNQYSICGENQMGGGGNNVFLIYLDCFSGVDTNLGFERHQLEGLNPNSQPPIPTNRALRWTRSSLKQLI